MMSQPCRIRRKRFGHRTVTDLLNCKTHRQGAHRDARLADTDKRASRHASRVHEQATSRQPSHYICKKKAATQMSRLRLLLMELCVYYNYMRICARVISQTRTPLGVMESIVCSITKRTRSGKLELRELQ